MSKEKQNKFEVTGRNCYALGIDAKVVPNGFCGHPNKRPINPNRLDGLPISERDWTHCVFWCLFGEKHYCTFAGECEHRIKGADDEQREAD